MVVFLRNNLPPHINPHEIDAELVLRGLFEDIVLSNEPALAPFQSPSRELAVVPDATGHQDIAAMHRAIVPFVSPAAASAAAAVVAALLVEAPTEDEITLARSACALW